MANTSADGLVDWYTKLLTYRNNSGSVSFYMAHGGTNFGFWAGDTVITVQGTASSRRAALYV
jgi:beta-galactosidase